ncbi:LeuD/DmdB family oxidoreductase small subunit [Haliovirga abyssi]|uniref:3-isopropylmalate dehydratase small subunit n=1 Tax=Haliovirga abyssi TaxID=2996794 RepID=A0AAU9D528_9FUSO|nr:3-isopropylmalate dehydratase [Haliovirga abyssi]BDU51161.1 3-isopropylmalate dehydratase small subunit [Haliovirga abyssi]
MADIIKGKAYVLGDNIDTDQIIPAMHLVYKLDDEEESKLYGKYAFSGLPKEAIGDTPFIKEGEFESEYKIVISGKNFGCGSSREHAPFALAKAGIEAVIAEDYARIFYRNSVDGGFLIPYETEKRLIDEIKTGDELEIDVLKGILKNKTSKKEYVLKELGDVKDIIDAGGLFNYAKEKNYIK